jgi:hypothetical protein
MNEKDKPDKALEILRLSRFEREIDITATN